MTDLNRALRPQSWDDVIGQDDVKEICRKALAENKFPKFSIFYGPTGVGKSCIAELIAKELTHTHGRIEESKSIQKFNMAALLGKNDIVSIIDNIFRFKAITDTAVFILEEVQVLRQKEEQSPFLEELTRIPDNVYVIMATTKISALSLELRNRAILFQLGLPTFEECSDFVDSITSRLNFSPMAPRAKEVLIKASDYTPRSIVKHIELLASGDTVSEEDVNKFFKSISNASYLSVLQVLADDNVALYEFTSTMRSVLKEAHASSLFYGFRDFLVQLLLEQATKTEEIPMTIAERELSNRIMQNFDESRFVSIFEALSKGDSFRQDSAKDVLAAFVAVKLSLLGKKPSAIVAHNASEAVASTVFSRQNARSMPRKNTAASTISQITEESNLGAYGVGDDYVYHED